MRNKQAIAKIPVWNESLDLVKSTYVLTNVFPEEEQECIVKAIKQFVISIPGGISKAMQTEDNKLGEQYLEGSVNAIIEIESLFAIAQKLEYITEQDVEKFTDKSNQLHMQIKDLIRRLSK